MGSLPLPPLSCIITAISSSTYSPIPYWSAYFCITGRYASTSALTGFTVLKLSPPVIWNTAPNKRMTIKISAAAHPPAARAAIKAFAEAAAAFAAAFTVSPAARAACFAARAAFSAIFAEVLAVFCAVFAAFWLVLTVVFAVCSAVLMDFPVPLTAPFLTGFIARPE